MKHNINISLLGKDKIDH